MKELAQEGRAYTERRSLSRLGEALMQESSSSTEEKGGAHRGKLFTCFV